MRSGFDIKNKDAIVAFFNAIAVAESYTFQMDVIFDEGVFIVTDRNRQDRELIQVQLVFADSISMEEDSSFQENGQDYVMGVYYWNSAPVLSNAISSNNNDEIDLTSLTISITNSLNAYEANQSDVDYNADKYSIDTNGSILAQTEAVDKILITSRIFERSRDLSIGGVLFKTETEAASEEATRKASRLSALSAWKTATGWS